MSFSIREIEQRYKAIGLQTRHQIDEPGTVYKPHRHEGVRIFTIKGAAKVRLEKEPWQTVEAGEELIIKDDELHEAKVGKEPWEYIFAASPEEMRRQGL